jgi:hypothetical protein
MDERSAESSSVFELPGHLKHRVAEVDELGPAGDVGVEGAEGGFGGRERVGEGKASGRGGRDDGDGADDEEKGEGAAVRVEVGEDGRGSGLGRNGR